VSIASVITQICDGGLNMVWLKDCIIKWVVGWVKQMGMGKK